MRYTTWPSPAIRQTDREMGGKGAEQEQRGCRKGGSRLKRGEANEGRGKGTDWGEVTLEDMMPSS